MNKRLDKAVPAEEFRRLERDAQINELEKPAIPNARVYGPALLEQIGQLRDKTRALLKKQGQLNQRELPNPLLNDVELQADRGSHINGSSMVGDLVRNLKAFDHDDVHSNLTQARLRRSFGRDLFPQHAMSICNELDVLSQRLVENGATENQWKAVISMVSLISLDPREPMRPEQRAQRLGIGYGGDSRTTMRERGEGKRFWEIGRS